VTTTLDANASRNQHAMVFGHIKMQQIARTALEPRHAQRKATVAAGGAPE
jgi:hypothetical protein